jgi:hypothetical protein
MWDTIINPENGKRVYTKKKKGIKILNNYINHLGGAARGEESESELKHCNFNEIPNFTVNDTFEIRYIWTPGNRAKLSKYFDMTHHFIRINTKNMEGEKCIYTFGLKSGQPNSRLPFSREFAAIWDNIPSSLQSPDFFISWCSNHYYKPSLYKTRLGCLCNEDGIKKTYLGNKWCYIKDDYGGLCLGDQRYKQYSSKEDNGEEEILAGFWDWVDEKTPSEINPERRKNSVCVPDDSEIINKKIHFKGKVLSEPQNLNKGQIQFLKWFFENSKQGEIRGQKKGWKELPLPFKWTFATYKVCRISSGENCQSFALDFKDKISEVIKKIEEGEKEGKYKNIKLPDYQGIQSPAFKTISPMEGPFPTEGVIPAAQAAGMRKKSRKKMKLYKKKSSKKIKR